MDDITVIRDSRENKPYSFVRYSCDTKDLQLTTGDYALLEDCEQVNERTYKPSFAVERKSSDDFLQSITWERDRFEEELERADDFAHRMPVIVEANWEYFMDGRYYPDVHPNSIEGTVDTHSDIFYIDYFFVRDRHKAQNLTFDWLEWRAEQI